MTFMPMPFTINMRSLKIMDKGLLEDKVAIISGGARGVGKAIAISLAEQGCNIIIIS